MLIEKKWHAYNSRRYGTPWAARILFQGVQPVFIFIGRFAGGQLMFDAEPGEIVALGQKDNRGKNTARDLYLVDADGALRWIEEPEALKLWRSQQEVPAPTPDPRDALIAELVAALEAVAKIAWWSSDHHPYVPPPLSVDGRIGLLNIARDALAKARDACQQEQPE